MKWLLFSCLSKNIIKSIDNCDEDIDGSVHGYSNYTIEDKVSNDTIRIDEVEKFDNIEECSICFNIIIYRDKYTKEICNHIFHDECIKQWYDISKGLSCPLCRNNKSTEENINDTIILENLRKYICSGYCYRTIQEENMIAIE